MAASPRSATGSIVTSTISAAPATAQTSAYDTFSLRAGVCRDFAHLGITFCRALGIPARFVSAYGWQLVPQDFHAVFEAYLGDRWYLFDATRTAPLDGLVRIAVGRDAADSAFSTFYGSVNFQRKLITVTRDEAPPKDEPWTTQAVSIAQRLAGYSPSTTSSTRSAANRASENSTGSSSSSTSMPSATSTTDAGANSSEVASSVSAWRAERRVVERR